MNYETLIKLEIAKLEAFNLEVLLRATGYSADNAQRTFAKEPISYTEVYFTNLAIATNANYQQFTKRVADILEQTIGPAAKAYALGEAGPSQAATQASGTVRSDVTGTVTDSADGD